MHPPENLDLVPIPSPSEMAAWDKATISRGVPSLELMERAGRGVVEVLLRDPSFEVSQGIVVLAGPGNNGGDGFVVARLLKERGYRCRVLFAGGGRYSPDCLVNGARFAESGGEVLLYSEGESDPSFPIVRVGTAEVAAALSTAGVIVDALLGTGQRAGPHGSIRTLIEALSHRSPKSRVAAIDIPSGVNGETGAVFFPAVRADLTISIQNMKRGLSQYPGRDLCGALETVVIGITPASAVEFHLLGEGSSVLPLRQPASHKGDFGHLLVIGGSDGMPGAPVLAASAGLRLGAGWVSLADAGEPSFIPELLRVCRGEGGRGAFGRGDIPAVVSVVKRADGVVVGPGIGTAEETGDFLKAILAAASAAEIPTVIDADGLTLVGERIETTNIIAGKPVVLTPHPGEAARLLGVTSSEVQSDRFHAAREMANRFGCTVVLKGAGTVVYGEGRGFVCPFGTPYLAAPGSGDVLAGFIGALLAQGYPPLEAACRGTVIHARAGEMAHRQRGGYLIASDIFHAVGTTVRFV